MNGRDVARTIRLLTTAGGRGAVRSALRRARTDARHLPGRVPERARVPGPALGAEPVAGGGVVKFTRSRLTVRVVVGGAVFCGWDGAEPEPSYALAAGCPEPDPRAVLEPVDDGWRVRSERLTVIVRRQGAVEFRSPGGVVLREEEAPRWWEPADGAEGGARWAQRSTLPADARVLGLGARTSGPVLGPGAYRLWNTDPDGPPGPGPDEDRSPLTMPVQFVVADGGCHLVFHDNTRDGVVSLRSGVEGAGSGHDVPGGCEVRFDGGPLRYWVMAGAPERVLRTWTGLTGRPALPPRWALGHHHALGAAGGAELDRIVAGYRERGLAVPVLQLAAERLDDRRTAPDAAAPDTEPGRDGVRLVAVVDPAVRAEPGLPWYEAGLAAGAFVRDARGAVVRGRVRSTEAVFPDFTDPAVRRWWGEGCARWSARGFSGVWHERDEPASRVAFGDPTLPLSARHAMEGRGGDHRAAHNVYGLLMARAAFESMAGPRPAERPFVVSRSGWAGLQRYGGAWAAHAATGPAGPRAGVALVLGLGLCGVPFAGIEMGGPGGRWSAELAVRWFRLAAYLPFFRTRSGDGGGRREPWEFAPAVSEHVRAALAERERLGPYLDTLAFVAHRTGVPWVRPLWWADPADREARAVGDAFLLGDALLVAPVLEAGATRRRVWLPRGWWYDTAGGAVHRGPGPVVVDAPLDRVPVLARAGAVVPVAGAGGGVELEVWAPVGGDRGGGVLVTGGGAGGAEPVTERFTVRRADGAVLVERDGADRGGVPYPVRVRGAV